MISKATFPEITEGTDTKPRSPVHDDSALPHVAWRCIASHLSSDLNTLFDLAALSADLKDICQPHISAFFEVVGTPWRAYPSDLHYHRVLELILEGYINASAIFEIHCSVEYKQRPTSNALASRTAPRQFFGGTVKGRSGSREQQCRRLDHLVRETVRSSLWIKPDRKDELCMRFHSGCPDAALAILLPLCTKLKVLEIPQNAPDTAAVVQAVARQYRLEGTSGEEARQRAWQAALRDRTSVLERKTAATDPLPFSELMVLFVGDHFDGGAAFPLAEMIPFTGIPSLHRIIVHSARDLKFQGRSTDVVTSTCPEIYFQQASVGKQAVRDFAQALTAPCEIRQWFEHNNDWSDPELHGQADWDHVLIESSGDGSKTVDVRLDYDGGDPGYDYPWVSWLWHGKMRDWRRLDEEFSGEEADVDEIWLGGSL